VVSPRSVCSLLSPALALPDDRLAERVASYSNMYVEWSPLCVRSEKVTRFGYHVSTPAHPVLFRASTVEWCGPWNRKKKEAGMGKEGTGEGLFLLQ